MRFKSIWLSLYYCLVFFLIGAGALESFVNYPSWYIIGKAPKEVWTAYHLELSRLLGTVFIIPGLLIIPMTISLFWLRPKQVKVWTIWISLVLILAGSYITPNYFWPIQHELDAAFTSEAVDRLIHYDILVRKLMEVVQIAVLICIMVQASRQPKLETA